MPDDRSRDERKSKAFADYQWLRLKEVLFRQDPPAPLKDLLNRRVTFPQVLDCGTGIGSLIGHLVGADEGSDPLIQWERLVGVDMRGDLLELFAHPKLSQVEGVLLLQGDVTDLRALRKVSVDSVADEVTHSLDDETFDLVVSQELVEHVPHQAAALREMWRVLKPGGTLLCLRNAESDMFLEPAHDLDETIFGNFFQYVFTNQSERDSMSAGDYHCGRKLWHCATEAGLVNVAVTSTPWLVYPPLTADERVMLRHIIEAFFRDGSTSKYVPPGKSDDLLDAEELEKWCRQRLDEIESDQLVFYANFLSLSAYKPPA